MDEVEVVLDHAPVTHTATKTVTDTKPMGNAIMTQMVRQLTLTAKYKGALSRWTVDTRGVFGPVNIKCLESDSCNGMIILFQKQQNYGYVKPESPQSSTSITITCGPGACHNMTLLRADDPYDGHKGVIFMWIF